MPGFIISATRIWIAFRFHNDDLNFVVTFNSVSVLQFTVLKNLIHWSY